MQTTCISCLNTARTVRSQACSSSQVSLNHPLLVSEKLPVSLAKFYTAEMVSGLEFMHNKRVVHRDLKPENILLDKNFHLKLVRVWFRVTHSDGLWRQQKASWRRASRRGRDRWRWRQKFTLRRGDWVALGPEVVRGNSSLHIARNAPRKQILPSFWSVGTRLYNLPTSSRVHSIHGLGGLRSVSEDHRSLNRYPQRIWAGSRRSDWETTSVESKRPPGCGSTWLT